MAKHPKHPSLTKGELIRLEAIHAAADVFGVNDEWNTKESLWALCVFFESYINKGAKGTRKDFAPKRERRKKAPVIRLVTK
jgi:hypothetical protein